MFNSLLIFLGRIFSRLTQRLNLGHGSTWPGHIVLKINKNFIKEVIRNSEIKVIIIAGTNGKTTTAKLITAVLEKANKKVLHNSSGANLLNGIASTILLNSGLNSKLKADYAVFEVDENALPLVLKEISPDYFIILNLFRDQLDRYGEVHTIAHKWRQAISSLKENTTLILNADDPQIAYLNNDIKLKTLFFGVNSLNSDTNQHIHALDSVYCPKCGYKLFFKNYVFSHLGDWTCRKCSFTRPKRDLDNFSFYPLPGIYNKYNTHAAALITLEEKISKTVIEDAFKLFTPAFGRQEEIIVGGKKASIFLSKNPTGFNESLRTAKSLGARVILTVLNDRIPDGRDVSWIWDTDIENILNGNEDIIISGDRVFDMALRIKYSRSANYQIEENLEKAIQVGFRKIDSNEIFYIIPTYSAMLEVRKILTGKKIL